MLELDASLDDAFRRLAAKNQLSHCKETRTRPHTTTQSAHSHREQSETTLKLQGSENLAL